MTLSTIKSGASGKLNKYKKYKDYTAMLQKKGFAIMDFFSLELLGYLFYKLRGHRNWNTLRVGPRVILGFLIFINYSSCPK